MKIFLEKLSLREKCLNTEYFLFRIFPHSDCIQRDLKYLSVFSPKAGKYGPEKTPYLTFFTQCMALKVISKINCRLRFLYKKNRFLSLRLRRLLCNALIQPHFDYACSAWYPNLNNRLKLKLQILQNKCIRFCLN